MSYALDRAAEELESELKRYDIRVPKGERVILWNDVAIQVSEGTQKKDCLRKLRKLIKIEKQKEFERTQVSLL